MSVKAEIRRNKIRNEKKVMIVFHPGDHRSNRFIIKGVPFPFRRKVYN